MLDRRLLFLKTFIIIIIIIIITILLLIFWGPKRWKK
jgi:hypothetical protein